MKNPLARMLSLTGWLFFCQFSWLAIAQVKLNIDKPLKGAWDFKLKRIWEIDQVGKKPLSRPQQILITKGGKLVLVDRSLDCIHVLNERGKKLFTFACKGVGQGRVSGVTRIFAPEDLVVIDGQSINYFSTQGKFKKAIRRKSYFFSPRLFVNNDIFIGAPYSKIEVKKRRGKIVLVDLKRKRKKTLGQFYLSPYGIIRQGDKEYGLYDEAFTPAMVVGHYQGKLFYGLNDSYTISVSDLSGNKFFTFGIKRKVRTVTADQMRKRLKGAGFSALLLADLLHQLPKKMSFFNRIEAHSGYVFVFQTPLELNPRNRTIDIFALNGDYLYQGNIYLPGQRMMTTIFSNLIIKNNVIYLVYRNDAGKVFIGKYGISMPGNQH